MKTFGKKCTFGVLIFLMMIGVVALKPPQKAFAGLYDNAVEFYNTF